MIEVSIVIVCMNNLKNLYPCLESIKKQTSVSYETFVVAYLFSPENLEKVKADFPWVRFIESNEIRGFSENNNLALRLAQGKYCFVLNDDTEMKMPVVDRLVDSIEKTPDAAIMSPVTYFGDGRLQSSGRPKHTMWTFLLGLFGLWKEPKIHNRYTYQKGIFQSYNIVGAAFLIKTDIFRDLGWFDEKYFFCPEDLALSTLANERGYKCYVDADCELTHFEGGTWSLVKTATTPTSVRGSLIWRSRGSILRYAFMGGLVWSFTFAKMILSAAIYCLNHSDKNRIRLLCKWNTLQSIFTRKTTKEIFIKFYKRVKK